MNQLNFIQVVGFGPNGWGLVLLAGAGVTLAVAGSGMLLGMVLGTLGAWAKISRSNKGRRLRVLRHSTRWQLRNIISAVLTGLKS